MRGACSPTRLPDMFSVQDVIVRSSDGHRNPVRIYRPEEQVRAIIVWAHGGGFALGSIEEIDNFSRLLAVRTGCVVASVEYRLAPEHKFPAAIEDVEAASAWVAARRGHLAGAPVPVWIGGDSAGGNLATVVTRKLHESKTAQIAGNILVYPCTDSPEAESLRRFVPPFMTVQDVSWFIDMYLPGPEMREHPDFAPIRAASLHLLPPTLVITAEHDILTEQAEAYVERLSAHGVSAEAVRTPGMIHGFLTLDPFLASSATDAIDLMTGFIDRNYSRS